MEDLVSVDGMTKSGAVLSHVEAKNMSLYNLNFIQWTFFLSLLFFVQSTVSLFSLTSPLVMV